MYHAPPEDKRCEARTDAGPRCTKWIVGARYCERHRHLESTNGGPGAGASVTASPTDHNAVRDALRAMPLESTGDAIALLNAARQAMIAGAISEKMHASIVTSTQTILRHGSLRDEQRAPRREEEDRRTLSLEELAARVAMR